MFAGAPDESFHTYLAMYVPPPGAECLCAHAWLACCPDTKKLTNERTAAWMMMVFSTPLLVVWSWTFRYVQIALDTMVLYGVLRERSMDERGDGASSGPSGLSSQQRTSRCGTRGGPGGPDHSSKPVPGAPLI